MAEGLAEKGNNFNCRECKYGSECNTANAHGYKVGFCSQYTQKTKAQTNADRIRSMTDEELSSWINDHADCTCRCEAWKDGCMDSDSTCMAAWLEWLKEDVKDGET